MTSCLRVADVLAGLSLAADLGFGVPPDEAVRSCIIGVHVARHLGLQNQIVSAVYYTALLHHVGCTAFAHETSVVFGDEFAVNVAGAKTNDADTRDVFKTFLPEVTRNRPALDRARIVAFTLIKGNRFGNRFVAAACEVARETAGHLGLSAEIQESLYHLYEWFNGKGAPDGLKGNAIPLAARIVRVASLAALFDSLGGKALAVDALRRRAGSLLDPVVVAAFADHAELLAAVNADDPRTAVLHLEPEPVVVVPEANLADAASAFADVADLKSPFFHGHSRRVATLAEDAGRRLGLDEETIRRLRVAALLHDLGRVSVSDAVWEKPGPLTSVEWDQVRLHAYQSERILAACQALRSIAPLAGMHHERQDGSGYHRGLPGSSIPVAARILAASDVYVALTQERPHRPARHVVAAAEELRAEARRGRLDADIVECVLAGAGQGAGKRRPRPADLTEREVQVVRLVAKGLSNREIARKLAISPRTAEHHVQHVYDKIGLSTRAGAALFAMKHALLD